MWTQDPALSGQPCHTLRDLPSIGILAGSWHEGVQTSYCDSKALWPLLQVTAAVAFSTKYHMTCREQEKMEFVHTETDKVLDTDFWS